MGERRFEWDAEAQCWSAIKGGVIKMLAPYEDLDMCYTTPAKIAHSAAIYHGDEPEDWRDVAVAAKRWGQEQSLKLRSAR